MIELLRELWLRMDTTAHEVVRAAERGIFIEGLEGLIGSALILLITVLVGRKIILAYRPADPQNPTLQEADAYGIAIACVLIVGTLAFYGYGTHMVDCVSYIVDPAAELAKRAVLK
jgi:hypothetical protein